MKSTMSQILLIILAIAFAAALTVIIILICLSYLGNGNDPNTEESREPAKTEETDAPTESKTEPEPLWTLPEPSDSQETSRQPADSDNVDSKQESEGETPSEPTESEAETQPPETPGGGLSFASNGNGTCTLISIGTCTDVCVVIPERSPAGDRVTSIAPRAFYAASHVTAIQIPSSVASIGELAFAACDNLVYISVNVKNPYYCDVDGVLYTADESTLILYPPCRVGNAVQIQTVTTAIADMAFFDCTHLSHVTYAGSAEEWDRIRIGIRNHSLIAASKSFAGGTGSSLGQFPNHQTTLAISPFNRIILQK